MLIFQGVFPLGKKNSNLKQMSTTKGFRRLKFELEIFPRWINFHFLQPLPRTDHSQLSHFFFGTVFVFVKFPQSKIYRLFNINCHKFAINLQAPRFNLLRSTVLKCPWIFFNSESFSTRESHQVSSKQPGYFCEVGETVAKVWVSFYTLPETKPASWDPENWWDWKKFPFWGPAYFQWLYNFY